MDREIKRASLAHFRQTGRNLVPISGRDGRFLSSRSTFTGHLLFACPCPAGHRNVTSKCLSQRSHRPMGKETLPGESPPPCDKFWSHKKGLSVHLRTRGWEKMPQDQGVWHRGGRRVPQRGWPLWAGYFKTGKSKSKNLQEQSQVQRPGSPSERLSLGGKRQ